MFGKLKDKEKAGTSDSKTTVERCKNRTIIGHAQALVLYMDDAAGDRHLPRECFPMLNLGVVQCSRWSDLPVNVLSPLSPPMIISTLSRHVSFPAPTRANV